MNKLEKVEKVKIIAELFELVQYYYEYRDQPMKEGGNFLSKVEDCCNALEIDFTEFNREFKIGY
ncbi:hypothetical protein [Peribacillus frigoritolerans]|uniref:hypothetical protein n=1 Tax=Peribacillus frigoritolerans TaxID=450367 RepID=UPI003F805B96